MRGIRFVATVFSITFWVACFCLASVPAYAQKIPALATIPAGLPDETEARLSQRRQELDREYYRFKKAADDATDVFFFIIGGNNNINHNTYSVIGE